MSARRPKVACICGFKTSVYVTMAKHQVTCEAWLKKAERDAGIISGLICGICGWDGTGQPEQRRANHRGYHILAGELGCQKNES